jgi:hypothetical protein
MEKEFKELLLRYQNMQKLAFDPVTFGAIATGVWTAKGIAMNHFLSPLLMNYGMNTDKGQKMSAGMFSAGIEHGKKGRDVQPTLSSFNASMLNKDLLKDYRYGQEIGKALQDSKKRDLRNDPRLKEMYKDLVNQFGNTPEKLKELKKTPLLGAFYHYMNKQENEVTKKTVEGISVDIKKHKLDDKKMSTSAKALGAASAYGLMALNPIGAVDKALIDSVQLGIEQNKEPEKLSPIKRKLSSALISPRLHDRHKIKTFISSYTDDEDVVNKYVNFVDSLKKMNHN